MIKGANVKNYHNHNSSSQNNSHSRGSAAVWRPLVVVMFPKPGRSHVTGLFSLKSHYKLKITVFVLAMLLVVQYFYFTPTTYDMRFFDQRVSQYYFWALITNHSTTTMTTTPSSLKVATTSILSTTTIPMTSSESDRHVTVSLTDHVITNLSMIKSSSSNVSADNHLPFDSRAISTVGSTIVLTTTTVLVPSPTTRIANGSNLETCPEVPPGLVGPIKVWRDNPSWTELIKMYSYLEDGGHGKPTTCIARSRVAIILPYRDREEQLRAFLHNMHSLLTKQQLDYRIFVVEQIANQTFNRAKLFNVGYVVAKQLYDFQCFIFHDVDLLPQDDRNLYNCPDQPRHMSVAIDKFNYKLPYSDIFGGISALTVKQFESMNGFSNDYWGWGGEDDDMAYRVKLKGYQISRYPSHIARYVMIRHQQEKSNPVNTCRYSLMYKVKQRWQKDGLSTLTYNETDRRHKKLFTWVLVDLLEEKSRAVLKKAKLCEK